MPLLIDAVLKRLTPADDEYKSCQQALMSLNDVRNVRLCYLIAVDKYAFSDCDAM